MFNSENESYVFRPNYSGEIWKGNNDLYFWICVWVKLWLENILIILTQSFSKYFPSSLKRKAGVLKFIPFIVICDFDKFRFRDGLKWTGGLTAEI